MFEWWVVCRAPPIFPPRAPSPPDRGPVQAWPSPADRPLRTSYLALRAGQRVALIVGGGLPAPPRASPARFARAPLRLREGAYPRTIPGFRLSPE